MVKVLFLHLERRWLQLNTSGKARFNHYNRHSKIGEMQFPLPDVFYSCRGKQYKDVSVCFGLLVM